MSVNGTLPNAMPTDTFEVYLLNGYKHKLVLCIAAIAMAIQFGVFKYFYPYASYIHGDSFVYLNIAYNNSDIESYMVGYGRFLRFFSVFSRSDTILVAFQYLLLQTSTLYFLSTLFYFYRPRRAMQLVLICFMVINPLFIYMANLISSDGLFLALSLTWFSLLLWIIHKPSTRVIVWHTIVLFITFTVRYNALAYPAIATVVILLSRLPIAKKAAAIGAAATLCGLFVLYTGERFRGLTGTWQYSPFSGWLMSNNAMYAYRYVDSSERKAVPDRFKALDRMIRTYFDSSRDVKQHPWEAIQAGTSYMWNPRMPLYKYRDELFKKDTAASELKKWASMGTFYKSYGFYIIQQYPLKYALYFLWPNMLKYYAPPVEFLASYNSNHDYVLPIARRWFGYKSTKVTTRTKNLSIGMLDFYPIMAGVSNVVMLCGMVCFTILKGFQINILFRKGVMLAGVLWLLNALFTIFASSAALRFQSFPVLLAITFALLLMDWIWTMGIIEEKKSDR